MRQRKTKTHRNSLRTCLAGFLLALFSTTRSQVPNVSQWPYFIIGRSNSWRNARKNTIYFDGLKYLITHLYPFRPYLMIRWSNWTLGIYISLALTLSLKCQFGEEVSLKVRHHQLWNLVMEPGWCFQMFWIVFTWGRWSIIWSNFLGGVNFFPCFFFMFSPYSYCSGDGPNLTSIFLKWVEN